MRKFTVTQKATRPAGDSQSCFYCKAQIGSPHLSDCVLIQKKVKVRMTIEYNMAVPSIEDKEDIEFKLNESSWCSGNAIEDIHKFLDGKCLCGFAKFEYLEDTSEPYLDE